MKKYVGAAVPSSKTPRLLPLPVSSPQDKVEVSRGNAKNTHESRDNAITPKRESHDSFKLMHAPPDNTKNKPAFQEAVGMFMGVRQPEPSSPAASIVAVQRYQTMLLR